MTTSRCAALLEPGEEYADITVAAHLQRAGEVDGSGCAAQNSIRPKTGQLTACGHAGGAMPSFFAHPQTFEAEMHTALRFYEVV